jgi:hypothetical protein
MIDQIVLLSYLFKKASDDKNIILNDVENKIFSLLKAVIKEKTPNTTLRQQSKRMK